MKIICKEINDYLDYVKSNPEKINKYRKQLIKNIVEPTLNREDIFFDKETFEKCIKYCEKNFYTLFPYQKFIYAFVFMYKDKEPLFGTIIVLMGRGNGKDGFMMPLMNFLQTPLYGVKNYHIDIIANNEDQAKDSFDVVYEMLESNKRKFKKLFYWSKESIINLKTRSKLRYNTSNAKTKDGKKAGALLYNEYHAYESYDQINVFSSELGKIPHPRKFIITTQGYVRDGPLDDLLTLCKQILMTGENDLGYFPFLCVLDDIAEVDNEEKWVLPNPSMEYMPVLASTIKKDYAEMKRLPSKRAEFITKRMNLPERDNEIQVASWKDILYTTYSDIELKTPIKEYDLKGRNCVIGIDYADIRDFASAGLLFKIDGVYVWRQKTWICRNSPFFESIKFPFQNKGQEFYQDFEIVDSTSLSVPNIVNWCIDMMQAYNVQKIVMDTYRFSLFRECFEQIGLQQETKKDPYGLVRMIRHLGAINTLTAPLIEQSFSDRKINFGKSALMRWYTNNTSVSIDRNGNKNYGKIEPKLRKNDGFMAFVVAMSAEDLLDEVVIIV
jgi:phage terminase large subunit-like protein